MWRILLLAITLVSGVPVHNPTDTFLGEWTMVAMCPSVIFLPIRIKLELAKPSVDKPCDCPDGKKTEILEGTMKGMTGDVVKTEYLLTVIDNSSEVDSVLGVNCTCGGKAYPHRAVVRSLDNNYFVMYKPIDQILGNSFKATNVAMVYAKELPKYEDLGNFMNGVPDFKNRTGAVMWTTEYESAYNSNTTLFFMAKSQADETRSALRSLLL